MNIRTAVAFALCLALAACTKPDNKQPYIFVPATLRDYFSALGPQALTVSFSAASGVSVVGRSGTRYVFAPNAFAFANGSSVTGNIELQMTEVLTKADMMFSGILPYSNGDPLISGGELDVRATQNGQNVYLKPGMTMNAHIPQGGAAPAGMEGFFGKAILEPGANRVNWTRRDSTQGSGPQVYVVANGDTVEIISDTVGLVNADRFLANPNYQSFNVHIAGLPATVADMETRAYAFFDGQRAAWNMYGLPNSNHTFPENHVPDIPVHFVVVCVADTKLYAGVTAVTPHSGNTYMVNVAEVTAAELKALVAALP